MAKQETDKKEAAATEVAEQPANKDGEIEVIESIPFEPRSQAGEFELRFSPYAWAKIRWIRDYCNSEIAGFGISSMEDPFYMEDFRTLKQTASAAHFEFDDDALNDYLAGMFEEGKQPGECMRLWVHTHPTKDFASPSGEDEGTFTDAFGNADWAMMIIMDEGDNVYARLRFKSGASRLQMVIPNSIDCQPPLKGVDEASAIAWKQEADENITQEAATHVVIGSGTRTLPRPDSRRHHHHQRYAGFDPGQGYPGYPEYEDRGPASGYDYMERVLGPTDVPAVGWAEVQILLMDDERVVQITTEKDSDNVLVLLNSVWLIYDADVTPKCKEGAIINDARDIAEIPPRRCGELFWETDKQSGVIAPTYESEIVDGFVQYFAGAEETGNVAAAAAAVDTDDVEELDIEVVGEVRVGPHGP